MSEPATGGPRVPRDEIAATVATSRELGHDYDEAVAEALAQRLEQVVDARVEARLAQRPAPAPPPAQPARVDTRIAGLRFALAVVSLVLAVPLTAIAASLGAPWMMFAVWIGVALVNVAFILGTRR